MELFALITIAAMALSYYSVQRKNSLRRKNKRIIGFINALRQWTRLATLYRPTS